MKRLALVPTAVLVMAAGCSLPQDEGIVMGCFGLVNETIPGQDVFSNQVVTNMFFGGCSPDDVGMQIMERATQAASQDQALLAGRCDADCNTRLASYIGAHPEVNLPLTCQTLFVSACDGLSADVSGVATTTFQAGGPADTRYTLTGTVTVTVGGVASPPVPATGIIDGTLGPCQGGPSCAFTLSRLDVVGTPAGPVNGAQVDSAHVQNQGLINGIRNPTDMVIAPNAIEAEVSAVVNGMPTSFHVFSSSQIRKVGSNLTLDQFLETLDLTMTGQGGVSVQIHLNATPFGHRPVAAITSLNTTYECVCKECTTVELASAATDEDNDLQSLSWKVDGVLQIGDGTSAPQTLDLQLPVGAHSVTLVATDTRGAAAAATLPFSVVDTTPPVVTPPPNITLRSCDFPDIGSGAAATDTCSDTLVISSNASGNYFGTTTVTWSAEDLSGNRGTATQTVTVTQVADSACCPPGYNVIVVGPNQTGTINGTAGNDCIIGTSNNNTINGNDGNDYIIGGGGQDTLNGGNGNDVLLGGDGDDILSGGNGDDRIAGGTGQDNITGGAGIDRIIAGDGDDIVNGGDGNDNIQGNQGQDQLIGGPNNDFIDGGFGGDTITGGTTPSTGNAGDDFIVGSFDHDTITDALGNNFLAGFQGDDRLTGGSGNDTILGGGGHNVCVGGGGTDTISCIP